MTRLTIDSPVGPLTISAEGGTIVAITFGADESDQSGATNTEPVLLRAKQQLMEYFAGTRTSFDLPLKPSGSAFRSKVWQAMAKIPYGQTRTYGDLARTVDSAPRAIGGACGANPLPIVVPCHRVVASGGALGGFSGGKGCATKRQLLDLEARELHLSA